eukprot:7949973-Ditylum_brightwellii.AAC.1
MLTMSAVQQKVEQYIGTKLDNIMRLDTEEREGNREGFVAELDEKTRHAAYSILSEATSRGYEQIQKSFAQDRPSVEKMDIVPINSPYD